MEPMEVRCPDCSRVMRIDEDRDFVFCQYCGRKIMLRNAPSVADLPKLRELLRERSANGVGGQDVVDICDKILSINPDDDDALIQKGYASRDLQKKLELIKKGVRNMEPKDHDRYFSFLSRHLADFVFYGDFTQWYPEDFSDIDMAFSEVRPEDSDKDDFLLAMIKRIGNRIINSDNPDDAVGGIAKYASLSVVALSMYCDIVFQREIVRDLIGQMGSISEKCGHTIPEREFDDDYFDAYCKIFKEFLEELSSAIFDRTKDMSRGDVEKIDAFWSENDLGELSLPLNDAVDSLGDIADMGFVGSVKAKRAISKTVEEYVDGYVNCRIPS